MNADVKHAFDTISRVSHRHLYQVYLDSISPREPHEVFWRFVFAYLSIHSTFRSNVLGYLAVRDPGAWESKEALLQVLKDSGCGLHNNRAEYLWNFRETYYDRSHLSMSWMDSFRDQRNLLVKKLNGIGIAKVSFAVEMSYPKQAEVVCFDVHLLRLYGIDPDKEKITTERYEELEADWVARSQELKLSPYAARCLFWDWKKSKPCPRYWTYVFEPGANLISFEDAQRLTFESSLGSNTFDKLENSIKGIKSARPDTTD